MDCRRNVHGGTAIGVMLLLGGAVGMLGCMGVDKPQQEPVSKQTAEIIKGFSANSAGFDAIGAVGFTFNDPFLGRPIFSFFCSGVLIGPRTVLTAKHCFQLAQQFQTFGATGVAFGIGPDANNPVRVVNLIDGEGAPGAVGGVLSLGPDAAVLYTAEAITDITPLGLNVPLAADVGKHFVVMGYGAEDNSFKIGMRRTGRVTLKGIKGKLYEIIFGSFERFREYVFTGTGRAPTFSPPLRSIPGLATAPAARDGGAGGGGGNGGPDAAPGPSDGSAPPEVDGGASGDGGRVADAGDPFDDFLRFIYDTTLLNEGYEVVLGGNQSDAQSCFGDSGGPLLRLDGGKLTIYGVASAVLSSSQLICDFGAIYATFGPGVLEFLESSVHFVDACEGLTAAGYCDGDVARRCTRPFGLEGPRQTLELDCSLLGGSCSVQPDGTAGCGSP